MFTSGETPPPISTKTKNNHFIFGTVEGDFFHSYQWLLRDHALRCSAFENGTSGSKNNPPLCWSVFCILHWKWDIAKDYRGMWPNSFITLTIRKTASIVIPTALRKGFNCRFTYTTIQWSTLVGVRFNMGGEHRSPDVADPQSLSLSFYHL